MSKLSKILLSIILIYEPLAYVLFVNYHNCREFFSWNFCSDNSLGTRIVLFLVVPIVLALLCSIWSNGSSKDNKHNNKNIKQSNTPQKIKQKNVSPTRIFIKKAICWYIFIILILGLLLSLARMDSEYMIDSIPYQIGQIIGNIIIVGLLGLPLLGGYIAHIKTKKYSKKNNNQKTKPTTATLNKNYGWQNWE